ncbi:MAG: Gfo/Idh/MocA family protein [Thermoguttaceae bacterium]
MIALKPVAWIVGVVLGIVVFVSCSGKQSVGAEKPGPVFRLGVIGTTTSHVPAFLEVLNNPNREGIFQRFEITAAYPGGMPDNPSSWERVDEYKKGVLQKGGTLYNSIEEMLPHVDGVLLTSVDGRCHLEQAKPVLESGKPMYIDKPLAASLADSVEIYRLAQEKNVPVFSCSSLRYSTGFQAARFDQPGNEVLGVSSWGPSVRNEQHPALFWYGVHGVEILFTIMGKGCTTVSCVGSADYDLAVGVWNDGRIGTYRGDRTGKGGYGAVVFGPKEAKEAGKYEGYLPLVKVFCEFFESGVAPIDPDESLEIMAFLEAAGISLAEKGREVSIPTLFEEARNRQTVFVKIHVGVGPSLTFDSQPVKMDEIAGRIDALTGPNTVVKVILSAEKGFNPEDVQHVCQQLSKAVLANFLYE